MQIFKRFSFYDIQKIKLSKFIIIHNSNIILKSISNDFIIQDLSSINNFNDNSIFFLKKNSFKNFNQIKIKNMVVITDNSEYYDTIKKKNSVILVSNIDEIYKSFLDTIFISDDHNSFEDESKIH